MRISAIIPTVGRANSLHRLLSSLEAQTRRPEEVVIADSSVDGKTAETVRQFCMREIGMRVIYVPTFPPNAVHQRKIAIASASGEMILLLDDDVTLEPECVAEMVRVFETRPDAVGVMAEFSNQSWAMPTRAWRLFLRYVLRMREGAWQGKVVGPLLRFGFSPVPDDAVTIDWLGAGNSMVRRAAYDAVGGFSDFFLHRCTMNEDVDLGLKLRRVGSIYFAPRARLAHYHAPGGRVTPCVAAEDDLYNRFAIFRSTLGLTHWKALSQVLLYAVVESISNLTGALVRRDFSGAMDLARGRWAGVRRAVAARKWSGVTSN